MSFLRECQYTKHGAAGNQSARRGVHRIFKRVGSAELEREIKSGVEACNFTAIPLVRKPMGIVF